MASMPAVISAQTRTTMPATASQQAAFINISDISPSAPGWIFKQISDGRQVAARKSPARACPSSVGRGPFNGGGGTQLSVGLTSYWKVSAERAKGARQGLVTPLFSGCWRRSDRLQPPCSPSMAASVEVRLWLALRQRQVFRRARDG
jgi:hypothetical protein